MFDVIFALDASMLFFVLLFSCISLSELLPIPIPPSDRLKTIKSEQMKMSRDLKRQLEKNRDSGIDWSKFKDTPSVVTHFVVVGVYGVTCRLVSSNHLAVFALSVLMVVHVVWFAMNSR